MLLHQKHYSTTCRLLDAYVLGDKGGRTPERDILLLFSCEIIPRQPKKLINFAGHFWKQ